LRILKKNLRKIDFLRFNHIFRRGVPQGGVRLHRMIPGLKE
jgi:hypothetical protein